MDTSTHMTLADIGKTKRARVVAGFALTSILVSQTLLPVTLLGQTSGSFDLNPVILGNSSMTSLVQANTGMNSALAQLNVASATVANLTTQYNAAETQVLLAAMGQGLNAPGMNLDQITDASKILPPDALNLAQISVNESSVAGALSLTQLRSGNMLSSLSADAIVNAALTDAGVDVSYVSQHINTNFDASGQDRYWYLNIMARARSSLLSYTGTMTLSQAKELVGIVYYGVPEFGFGYNAYETYFGPNMATAFSAAVNESLTRSLSGAVLSYTGVLDIAGYRTLFANTMIANTGIGVAATLGASLGTQTIEAFRLAVRNAIQFQIQSQFKEIWDLTSPSTVGGAVFSQVLDPNSLLGQQARTIATQAVDASISSGGVQLTQINDPGKLSDADVRQMVQGALSDVGLATTVSSGQTNVLVGNVTAQFLSATSSLTNTQIRNILAEQIGATLGIPNASTLVNQMSGQTTSGIEGAIRNVAIGNVVGQIGTLSSSLTPTEQKSVIGNSILSTTGQGDLSVINNSLSVVSDASLRSIATNIESIVDQQVALLRDALSEANIKRIVTNQLLGLIGLGDATSINAMINNSLAQSLSSITQVGAQLSGVNQSLTFAFDSTTLGSSSLTSSFNNTLPGMSLLSQNNVLGLSTDINGLISGLTAQINGSITASVNSLVGMANTIATNGLASLAQLTTLDGAVTSITNAASAFLPGAEGIVSLSGLSGVAGLSGMTSRPFGGPITFAFPCVCSGNYRLTIVNYAEGGAAQTLMFIPGRSVLYPMGQVYRTGPMTIGMYSGTSYAACVSVGWSGCSGYGGGPIITMVGTSI